MRMKSESESSEFVGFISNDPMTALTTTSDLFPSTCQPVSKLQTVLAPHTCLTWTSTYQLKFYFYFTSFLSWRLLEMKWALQWYDISDSLCVLVCVVLFHHFCVCVEQLCHEKQSYTVGINRICWVSRSVKSRTILVCRWKVPSFV